MKLTVLSSAAFLVAASAFAQDNTQGFGPKLGAEEITPPSGQATIGELVSKGYQIKAAVPNGKKFVVFLQKDQSAYACRASTTRSTKSGSPTRAASSGTA